MDEIWLMMICDDYRWLQRMNTEDYRWWLLEQTAVARPPDITKELWVHWMQQWSCARSFVVVVIYRWHVKHDMWRATWHLTCNMTCDLLYHLVLTTTHIKRFSVSSMQKELRALKLFKIKLKKKPYIRETINLLAYADSSTYCKKTSFHPPHPPPLKKGN